MKFMPNGSLGMDISYNARFRRFRVKEIEREDAEIIGLRVDQKLIALNGVDITDKKTLVETVAKHKKTNPGIPLEFLVEDGTLGL